MITRHSVHLARAGQPLTQATLAYACFCILSILSRLVPVFFLFVVASGIAFPLVWARRSGDWPAIGFIGRKLGQAIFWGVLAGAVGAALAFLSPQIKPSAEPLPRAVQLAIGVPLWLLIMSPFQEFFFRGWLQPRFASAFGSQLGLLVTTLCFVVWHFLAPFQGSTTSSLDLSALTTVLTMVGMGLGFGYIFRRTGNIVAPWLAHAIMGIALVAAGGMRFLQYQ